MYNYIAQHYLSNPSSENLVPDQIMISSHTTCLALMDVQGSKYMYIVSKLSRVPCPVQPLHLVGAGPLFFSATGKTECM